MTRQQQKEFVVELSNAIVSTILDHIDKKKIPENWDGHELRALLARKHAESASMSAIHKQPRSKRKRAFDQEVLIQNL